MKQIPKRQLAVYQPKFSTSDPLYGSIMGNLMLQIRLGSTITQDIFDLAYCKAYEGKVECETLNEVFYTFNDDHLPKGYYYTEINSMTVGDVFRFDNKLFLVLPYDFEELDISTDIIDQKAE